MKIQRVAWTGPSNYALDPSMLDPSMLAPNTLGYRCISPAKINLFLEILGKRSDGYHNLDTVMLAIDLTDTLEIYPRDSDELTMELDLSEAQQVGQRELARLDPTWDIPTQASDSSSNSGSGANLVLKALDALRRALDSDPVSSSDRGKCCGAHVVLRKRIPSQAGLGGGSSDAAAALVLGSLLWQERFDIAWLARIAMQLGSDINFFLEGHNGTNWTARCTQRGEIVDPIANLIPIHGLIVHPPAGCPTGKVFAHLQESLDERSVRETPDRLIAFLESPKASDPTGSANQRAIVRNDQYMPAQLARLLYNRLETAASQTTAWIERTSRRIDRCDLLGQCLCGSGSARFALCSDRARAEAMALDLQREGELRAYPFSAWTSPALDKQVSIITHSRT
jgi:4-diphosphocytidyl-2-C-methyl-D-erythritol kinase